MVMGLWDAFKSSPSQPPVAAAGPSAPGKKTATTQVHDGVYYMKPFAPSHLARRPHRAAASSGCCCSSSSSSPVVPPPSRCR